ncbi:hypothetical protein TPHA_0P01440 [Tetrapisispora phaffii CBS 4417]|uniref:Uncharacterized protein n=1 Tax=Tetrapisispora phaffii (strain ATCC 24235 / CBS 4417 / NBRC 1672 / NRRL Y-8282 / UCD 70-5) TaxID=1071381 RepID=G8C2C4_TETPH|nr:hypothetical protein TPHA_0P01440 [Tetrapisispora phaffii CBS 4417]CCE66302.1 hypothetical protein TPHA_0P01440 [Tetrapisispora phaffii CBS 4417]
MELVLQAHILLASTIEDDTRYASIDKNYLEISKQILKGQSIDAIKTILNDLNVPKIDLSTVDSSKVGIANALNKLVNENIVGKLQSNMALLLAISLIQTFIQENYTGPATEIEINEFIFESIEDQEKLQYALTSILSISGQPAYELTSGPLLLILALFILEKLTNSCTLFKLSDETTSDPELITIDSQNTSSLTAFAHWWRARALLAQLSLLPETTGDQPAIAASIMNSIELVHAVVKEFPEDVSTEFKKKLYTIYYLENIKCSLSINAEQLFLPSLTKVMKLTDFKFVLTGARAKRTKFQTVAHSGLIILAQSSTSTENSSEENEGTPEAFALNSELLLEKPVFESIGQEPLDEQIVKKQKLDEEEGLEVEKLLPVAIRQESIPIELQSLDPNNQPQLTEYDNLQLLLRMYTLKQTSPAKDPLVEQELTALVSRILYQDGSKNWSIFSRCLWERSIIETSKAKTIERGLLQMHSLVEDLELQITSRLLPQSSDTSSASPVPRLKFIHQLPFLPRWNLDATLAEKYMSLGILKSAVEIYERLQMSCEAALCYAAVGDEKQAEEIILKSIEKNPNDARAISILGDIRQDPNLWLKSWEIGKYINAKNSLARYYYNPPTGSGLTRDYGAVLKHLNDSLRQFTLNFETWYFYGCVGLECNKMQLAAEAFSRCVALDDTHSMAWSNLSAANIELGKLKEALSGLKRAIACDAQRNWRIWENYMLVAAKLNEWDDVLIACRQLLNINKDKNGEMAIDIPVVEKLIELLVSTDFPRGEEEKATHFQKSCIEFVCNMLPTVITTSSRSWRLVAKVELWRKRPWAALDCHEKAYRAISHNPDLEIDEKIWNDTVDACEDLVAAYESLGEMEGRHGEGSLVCKDWKYKARSSIKTLMSKGKDRWDGTDGWDRLLELRSSL